MAEKILHRIRAAFRDGEHELSYHELALRVFPGEQFPRAWRYSSNGGPPGCYMALSAALTRFSIHSYFDGKRRVVHRPAPEQG
jgi:hypothetical protein